MKLVSIICAYNKNHVLNKYLLKSLKLQTKDYELILVDNRNYKFKSAASALNYGGRKAKGKYLIFCHQDISFTDRNWIKKTIKQIEQLENPGIIGVSGKSHSQFIHSNMKFGINSNLISPQRINSVEIATSIDDCLFIIPKKNFDILQFDEKNCFDWYLYATDYLLSLKKLNLNAYLIPSDLEHKSEYDKINKNYYKTIENLQKKHSNEKIIYDTLTNWKTNIPVSLQKITKQSNRKLKNLNTCFFKDYMIDLEYEEKYKEIDEKTYNLIKNSGFFDEKYYKNNYYFNFNKYDPIIHFGIVGYRKRYNPSLKFDTEYYIKHNPDVEEEDINPLEHYLKWGINEGRTIKPVKNTFNSSKIKHKLLNLNHNPFYFILLKSKLNPLLLKKYLHEYFLIKNSKMFDDKFYLSRYNILKESNINPIIHYMFIGNQKNYMPNDFLDIEFYKNKYGKKKNPIISYLKSNEPPKFSNTFIKNYNIVKKSDMFDEEYYVKKYPEVLEYNFDSLSHYMMIGYKEGRNPNENFDTKLYLDSYEDVEKANMNPLLHYIKYGQYENRIFKPLSQSKAQEIIDKIYLNSKNEKLTQFDSNSPLVSIIVLTRNGLNYLKILFENFEENICYPNYEIIVVDNNSNDNSIHYLKEISKKLPLTIIRNKSNESFSKANNKAVQKSNGEYILLLNNDMKPIYGWLNHMMTSYLKSEDIGIVGSKLIYPFRENNLVSLKTQNEGIKFTELNGFLDKDDGYIVPYNIKNNDIFTENEKDEETASVLGATLLIKKELYEKVGGLDENYIYNYEDIDLCFKVINEGFKIIYSPKSKLFHYYQATRKNSFDLSPNDMTNRIHFYRKWNKWLCEKLFIDKIENKLIYSENPLKISYFSKNYNLLNDELIQKTLIRNEDFIKSDISNKLIIKDIYWEIFPLEYNSQTVKAKNNSDIIISDDPNINPHEIVHNNVHNIKIALINNQISEWISQKNLNNYDLIFTIEKYHTHLKEHTNIYVLNNESIFLQIKNTLKMIYETDLNQFNKIIQNKDFIHSYQNAKGYLSILNSEYFDKTWYMKKYEIFQDNLDPVNHYLKIGFKKGFNPGPKFDNKKYYECNPDIARTINPLMHYELYGRDEKRQIKCSKEEKKSYKTYLSLINPKNHNNTRKLFKTKKNQIFFFSPWSDEKEGKLNENSQIIYENLNKKYDKKIYTFKRRPHIGDNLKLLQNLLESKVVILDQGCGMLSDICLKKDQKVINIWHACGAFKKIGYDVPLYSDLQLERFGKQFKQYTNFIVSSPKITGIYANAHGMDEENVLGLGVPRTDLFFVDEYKKKHLDEFFEKYPKLRNKELILYAPTFRDNYEFDTKINWKMLSAALDKNEILIIKRHIMTTEDLLMGEKFDNIIYIEDISIFTLMFASKLMITDYSSVIFEYSLLNKPVIHYCPDYTKYISIRDFYLDFNKELYGDIVKKSEDLIEIIKNKKYYLNEDKLRKFKDKFMSSCDGNATMRLIKLIDKYMEE